MAVNGQVILIDTSSTPNIGVSILDVKTVLGNNSNDLGTLCSCNQINKWARYKPIRLNKIAPITHADRKGLNFGLSVPYCIADATMSWRDKIMNGMVSDILGENYIGWEYLKPRGKYGDTIEYYRLSDFMYSPNDSNDPYHPLDNNIVNPNMQGYNHGARLPIIVNLTSGGYTYNDSDSRYHINKLGCNSKIRFTYYLDNSIGNELKLLDFIDFDYNQGTGDNDIAWRPVLLIFKDINHGGENNSVYTVLEWDRIENCTGTLNYFTGYTSDGTYFPPTHQAYEVAGDVITANTTQCNIEVDLSNFKNNDALLYHICLGVGCCKRDLSSSNPWREGGNTLFIIPYNNYNDNILPPLVSFYSVFSVDSYNTRLIAYTNLEWFNTGSVTYIEATHDGTEFKLSSSSTGNMWITFTISKDSQALHFVGENGSSDTGYSKLRIYLEGRKSGISIGTYYLTPLKLNSSNRYINDSAAYISAGSTSETATLNAIIEDASIRDLLNSGESIDFYTYVCIGDTNDWAIAGSFRVTRLSNN